MKKQITLAFLVIFALFGLGGGVIIYNMMGAVSSLRNLINLHEIEDIRQNLNLRVQKLQSYAYLPALDFSYNIDEVVDNVQQMEAAVEACFDCHHEPAVREDLEYTDKLIKSFQEKLSYLITSRSDVEWRRQNQQQAVFIADAIVMHVQDMVNRAAATLQGKTDDAIAKVEKTYGMLAAIFSVTLALAMAVTHFLTKRLSRPIDELLVAADRLAGGELGYQISPHGVAEFVALQESFNRMSASLAAKDKENKELYRKLEGRLRDLHRAQQQLVTAAKLASLGKLAGGISHDFNNLLCGIVGHVSLMKRTVADKETLRALEDIDKAAARASRLVGQLQTFAGMRTWRDVPVNVNSAVIAAVQGVQHELADEAAVHMDLGHDLPLMRGDPEHLRTMMQHICENAVQAVAGREGGLVEVGTAVVDITDNDEHAPACLAPGRYLALTCRDNGKGIPAEILNDVFDPYVSTRERSSEKGIGLGLAIAYVIAARHDGHIDIASAEGGGTTVTVYLPEKHRRNEAASAVGEEA